MSRSATAGRMRVAESAGLIVASSVDLRPPDCENEGAPTSYGQINRRDRRGGLLHEYYRAAA